MSYELKIKYLLPFLLILLAGCARYSSVSGILIDKETEKPIPNASIEIMNYKNLGKMPGFTKHLIITTDSSGNFKYDSGSAGGCGTLSTKDSKVKLKITKQGYKTFKKKLKGENVQVLLEKKRVKL